MPGQADIGLPQPSQVNHLFYARFFGRPHETLSRLPVQIRKIAILGPHAVNEVIRKLDTLQHRLQLFLDQAVGVNDFNSGVLEKKRSVPGSYHATNPVSTAYQFRNQPLRHVTVCSCHQNPAIGRPGSGGENFTVVIVNFCRIHIKKPLDDLI